LTIYIKNPCKKCDDVKEELAKMGPILSTVDIEYIDLSQPENFHLSRVYRSHLIPVIVLNGLFISSKRVDKQILMERLEEIERDIRFRKKYKPNADDLNRI